MSNAIDSVVSKQAQDGLDKLYDSLQKTHKEIIEMSKIQFKFNGGGAPSSPSDMGASIEQYKQLSKQIDEQNAKITQLETKIKSLRATRASNQRQDALEIINQRELRKNADAEAVAQSNLTTFIAKLSVERAKSAKVVADYNAQIAFGNTLTEQQTAELNEATIAFNKYDKAIKAGKASIGDAREYVGQYERANIGLSNSINQITRELPAFTFSAQTGFLAISNNVPILVDELSRLRAENARVASEGGEPVSILEQLADATFSWQTLLSVGITVITVYGKEIGEWAKSLFAGANALDAIAESQKQVSDSALQGTKNAQAELIAMKTNLAIAKDVNLSYKDRGIAVDNLIKQYPYYFENLTKEQILAGNTAKAEQLLTDALLARSKALAAVDKITANQSAIIDLELERIEVTDKLAKAQDRLTSARNRTNAASASESGEQAILNAQVAVNKFKSDQADIDEEIANLTKINNVLTGFSIANQKTAIGLDYNQEKSKGAVNNKRKEAISLNEIESLGNDSLIQSIQDQISQIEHLRNAVSNNGDEYRAYTRIIETLNLQLTALTDLDSLLNDGTEEFVTNQKKKAESIEEVKARMLDLNFQTNQFLEGIKGGFFDDIGLGSVNFFTEITQNGLTAFDTLLAGADTIADKIAITFKGASDIAVEALQFINDSQEAGFEAQYARLEQQKNIAIQFAGESATAREAIEEQYDRRRKDIQNQQAQAQKQQAIFLSIIGTAQASLAAYASQLIPGDPSSIPRAIAAAIYTAGFGAAKTVLIAAQEVPQFWRGTDNAPEGWATVDEKRPEVHTDAKGNIKSFGSEKGANFRYLNRGDKIYRSRDEYFSKELSKVLGDNGISMNNQMAKSGIVDYVNTQQRGISASELESVIKRTQPKQNNQSQFRIKKTEVNEFIVRLYSETQNKNNRYSGKGKSI